MCVSAVATRKVAAANSLRVGLSPHQLDLPIQLYGDESGS